MIVQSEASRTGFGVSGRGSVRESECRVDLRG